MRHRSATHRRRGWTLVELPVALLIFSVGSLALLATHTFAARARNDARDRIEVVQAVATLLDSLVALPCGVLTSGSAAHPRAAVRWVVNRRATTAELHIVVTPRRGASWALDSGRWCQP